MPMNISEVYPKDVQAEMLAYEIVLNRAMESNSSDLIPNSDENHASLMMTKLLENTTSEFSMIVGNFDGRVSSKPNYLEAMRDCLDNKKVKVKILFLEAPKADSVVYKLLIENKATRTDSNDIRFYQAKEETIDYLRAQFDKGKEVPHFSVFDNNKIRYENSPSNFSGWGSFNNEENASMLLNVFATAIKKADEINTTSEPTIK